MNRTEAITRLRQTADAVRGMGATALYVFGSTVRDEAGVSSDLDVFIDYDLDKLLLASRPGRHQAVPRGRARYRGRRHDAQ